MLGKIPVVAAYSRAQALQKASGCAHDGSDLLRRAACAQLLFQQRTHKVSCCWGGLFESGALSYKLIFAYCAARAPSCCTQLPECLMETLLSGFITARRMPYTTYSRFWPVNVLLCLAVLQKSKMSEQNYPHHQHSSPGQPPVYPTCCATFEICCATFPLDQQSKAKQPKLFSYDGGRMLVFPHPTTKRGC